jgi:cellulose synthase operon protein C
MTDNHIEGSVWGPSIQAGSIDGGVHVFVAGPPAPPVSAPHEPVTSWQEIPDAPDEVRSLLNAQVQAAHTLPYRLRGARRPSLATVYVRQDLSSGTEEQRSETSRPTPVIDDHGQLVEVLRAPAVRVAVRPPARTVSEALDTNEHLIVTGGAGQGKSTLSLRLAADIVARWSGETTEDPLTEPVVPLRLTARELAIRLDLPFAQALADSARAEYGALLRAPLQADLLSDRVAGCRWLLLVDGLDEVTDAADRDRLADVLAAWASAAASPYRLVVTTRPVEGAALAPLQRVKAARYELQPFDEQALRRFAENWFAEEGQDHAHRFVRQIRVAHLDELVRVPLLATIAAIIFQQQDRPLPDNQYELYEAYLAFLRSARTSTSVFDAHHSALLEHLGRTRVETDTSLIESARDWIRQSAAGHLPLGWPDDLTGYLISVGPLVIRGDDLGFLHHSFAEHLAATAQARLLPGHFDSGHDEFARLLYAARPKERGEYARSVLLHYTRLQPAEADPIVRWLHTGGTQQHLLAARLLSKRVPVSYAVVEAFLMTVRAWSMTTTDSSDEILSHASRATHYPGLAAWLVDLMRTDNAPWQSRTEAAAALATRLRGQHSREAITYLSGVVDDTAASIAQRLAAAEALADCSSSEHATAERGLRAVLANPRASGFQCRTAAVVLAVFGGQARQFAVDALTSLLTETTPVSDLVEAATGLTEIGPEFHDKASAVFRQVLRDPVLSTVGRRDAALGLVSLGPVHAAEAVSLVTALILDRRHTVLDRITMAGLLGELGPQHRHTAVDHIESILIEPEVTQHERWPGANQIAEFGIDFRDQAVSHLRSAIADPHTTAVNAALSARSLAKLSPEFVDEAAAELQCLLNQVSPDEAGHIQILDYLVELGEPYRSTALDQLHRHARNPGKPPKVRVQAAERLAQSNPDFHTEASRYLLDIAASSHNDHDILNAWAVLLNLGNTAVAHSALTAFIDIATTNETNEGLPFVGIGLFISSDADHLSVAQALTAVMTDPARSFRSRFSAAVKLLSLGRHQHAVVTDWACGVARSVTVPGFDFWYLAGQFVDASIASRTQVAEALQDALNAPYSSATRTWRIYQALDRLGLGNTPELITVLRNITKTESAPPGVRVDAATALATHVPDYVPQATDFVLRLVHDANLGNWQTRAYTLHRLGGNIITRLRAMADDQDTPADVRWDAGLVLVVLGAAHRSHGLAELGRQTEDNYRPLMTRGQIFLTMANAHTDVTSQAIAFLQAIVADEHEHLNTRIDAAGRLARFDRESRNDMLAVLRQFAEDDHTRPTPGGRARATKWLAELCSPATANLVPLISSITRLHNIEPRRVRAAVNRLERGSRTQLEYDLLHNRSSPIDARVPQADVWDDNPLADEAEHAIRTVLEAPESAASDRIKAAVALAGLSLRFVPEAAGFLQGFQPEQPYAIMARKELASLGQKYFDRVIAEAMDLVLDDTRTLRERLRTGLLISDLMPVPPPPVSEFLIRIAVDERTSDRDRLASLYALRLANGVGAVRAVRDDERRSPGTRTRAAVLLASFDVTDRSIGAQLVGDLATDHAQRPALRLFAARNLINFGRAGKDRSIPALYAIVTDESASFGVRADAARFLFMRSPVDRRALLKRLNSFLAQAAPLQRGLVLRAMAEADLPAAVAELQRMMRDRQVGALARLRCAETVVELQHPHRECAAIVAREVMHDGTAPVHVRQRAARNLARWSELCVDEARAMLASLAQ